MENKNPTIIIGLLALLVGLLLGYFFGTNRIPQQGFFGMTPMYQGMDNRMYGDALIDGDGALQHMMDEMMFIGRGESGEAYEEAWLRGMVVHHLGAVAMAENLLEETDRPELIELGNNIIESQSKEIEQMRGWLQTWFSEN